MILVHRQRFALSRYHASVDPDAETRASAHGPVLRVRVRFDKWLAQTPIDADVFIDPGADFTLLSSRWIEEQGGTGRNRRPWSEPNLDSPDHFLLLESATIEIGGRTLDLGDSVGIVPSHSPTTDSATMPGYEDILLGRDFLSRHHLLLIVDAKDATFSVLWPGDDENRRRRQQILEALKEP